MSERIAHLGREAPVQWFRSEGQPPHRSPTSTALSLSPDIDATYMSARRLSAHVG
jgi:hypothetical protein